MHEHLAPTAFLTHWPRRLSSPNVNEEIDCWRNDLDFIKLGAGRRFGTFHLARKGGNTSKRSPRRFQSNEYTFSVRYLICWTRIRNRVDRLDPNTKHKQLRILILRQKQQPMIKKKMNKKKSGKKHSQTRVSKIKLYYSCKAKIYSFHLKFTDLFHRQP